MSLAAFLVRAAIELTSFLLKRLRHAQKSPAQKSLLDQLTPTERKVMKLIGQFKTNKEIAAELFMGVRTVEQHRLNISEKFNLKGRHALVKFVTENVDRLKDKE